MNWLNNLPIRQKLTVAILATCLIALLTACGVLAGYELYEYRQALLRDTTVLANVLANNSRAALAFQDENAAHEIMLALQAEPYVSAACLYSSDGRRFAEYSPNAATPFPAKPAADGHQFGGGKLEIFRPVVLNEKRIGTIYVQTDLQGVYERLRLFGGMAALVLAGSILLAFGLSSRLQKPISSPITALAKIARDISERKDYAVRATSGGRDETGMLTDAFNVMLGGIEEREKALRATNETLRGEIAERQAAEGRVHAQLHRLELLHQITRAIGERQDLKSIFQVVIRNVEDRMPVDFCCVCLYDQAGTFTVASVGRQSEALASDLAMPQNSRIPIDQNGLSYSVHGKLIYEADTLQVQFPFPQRLARGGLRSLVMAPLLVESQVFGILVAARREVDQFSSADCEFLKQLSEHVALAAHQAQLYDALRQAYEDLRQTQQAVMQQERLRSLGQMASGVAHDINNAISPVALYTESLLENEPNLSERTRSYLTTIQRAVEDVAATVARMREFYRHREPQLKLGSVDLNQLIPQVTDLSRARWSDMAQQRGVVIELVTVLAEGLPAIMGVESEIREALVNLIFNAVDAMPNGGTLTLRTIHPGSGPARAKTAEPKRISVEVSDTGVGMDEETRRRCLEPFFTTKGERGSGLGLAMVYGMIQRHGGEVEIESAPGKGTTFRLIFPVQEAVSTSATIPEAAVPVPARQRILVVDDDPILIKSLRDILEMDGHVVVAANGGQEGIDAFRAAQAGEETFSAVITDLGMPYVDGRKVAGAVKGMSPSTPVIMLTGWGQRLVIEDDVPPEVDRVLSKPPKLRELREALAHCLHQKSSRPRFVTAK